MVSLLQKEIYEHGKIDFCTSCIRSYFSGRHVDFKLIAGSFVPKHACQTCVVCKFPASNMAVQISKDVQMILFQDVVHGACIRLKWPAKKVLDECDILTLFHNRYMIVCGCVSSMLLFCSCSIDLRSKIQVRVLKLILFISLLYQ